MVTAGSLSVAGRVAGKLPAGSHLAEMVVGVLALLSGIILSLAWILIHECVHLFLTLLC